MVETRNMDNPSPAGRPGLQPQGESESHPVATGVGAVGGGAAGAAAGTLAGPVGTVVGAVAGAVVGGLGGRALGQAFDPAEEDRYWRQHYADEPYAEAGRSYDDYGPAYTLGMSGRQNYGGSFDDAEERLSQEWGRQRAGSSLSWQQAREPSRAAWYRVESQYPAAGQSLSEEGLERDDGLTTGQTGTTVRAGREDNSADADLGLGLDSGRTYSTDSSAGRAERYDSHGPDQSNTLRSSGGLQDLGGAVGSARQAPSSTSGRDLDDLSFDNLSRTDSSMQGRQDTRVSRPEASEAGMGAFGAVGSAQSASTDDVSDTGDVVDVLNDLIECCRDGEYGFRLCAQHTQQPELKRVLSQHADDCQHAAQELMDCIGQLGGQIDDGGSLMGSMHRGWVSVKGTLAGYSDRAMLEEAERGEDTALSRYRHALNEMLPPAVHALVQRQAEGVKRKHDDIKTWRDRLQDRT
jgi:uncharacterized protein (TIGR02284 family)